MPPWSATSRRWSPTQEQLMILEEMYRGGIKTPNAIQIQRITAHLSSYGKIEGKNVFYWFQNHKARDRLKLRRKLNLLLTTHHQQQLKTHQHKLLYHSPSYNHPSASNSQLPPLHQVVGGVEDTSTSLPMNSKQVPRKSMAVLAERSTVDSSLLINNTWNNQYGWWSWRRRRMMMIDVGPDSPRCNRSLKTLQLFPITTTTTLKDQST